MSAKSKTKGRNFEYVVRDAFSKKFNNKFERVPLSGALAYLKGDVYCPWLPSFPYCIEAKHHKEVPWNNLISAKKSSLLLDFWKQTVREAEVMKKQPLLVYKWDRSKIYCCWADDTEVDDQITVKIDDLYFKMGLFDEWLAKVTV
jgi:hypothetical protein